MRLLISDEEKAHVDMAYPLPWRSTATCFNFKAPTRTILPGDVIKRPKMVTTLVIGCVLDDYSFISKMKDLEQLYIYEATNITDLSFLKSLIKLRQVCIIDAHVDSLSGLVELINEKYNAYKPYSELSPSQELDARLEYVFEGIFIQSDIYEGDGTELIMPDVCRNDIWVNGKHVKTGWFY